MPYTITINNQQKRLVLDSAFLEQLVAHVLRLQQVTRAELSVVIVTDRVIHGINRRFLGHDYPTDVITFDLSAQELSRRSRGRIKTVEGEIYLSAVTALRQARERRLDPNQELILYIVHGILHLLGYDDHSPRDRKAMRKKEKEIIELLMGDKGLGD